MQHSEISNFIHGPRTGFKSLPISWEGKYSKRMEKISLAEARALALQSQGLSSQAAFGLGTSGALAAVEHLGYVQIDTISVVERAHHHVIWTRVPDYQPAFLDQLLVKDKSVFEYWSHAASYLPMKDFRFALPRMRRYASGYTHWFTLNEGHRPWRRRILSRIRSEGPLSIRAFADPEFERKRGPGGWFERTPAKQMLEQLFMEGELMVSGRKGFEKFYDLTERFLPAGVSTAYPTLAEQAQHMIRSHLRAHGLMRTAEIGHLRKKEMKDLLAREARKMAREGEIVELKVEGIEDPYFALPGSREARPCEGVRILSPFDSQVIRRDRMRELFGFDYTIECYVPEAKRKFGYFVLPVLVDGQFAGRIDAKADRALGELQVRGLFAEKGVRIRELRERLAPALAEFARFNGCARVRFV